MDELALRAALQSFAAHHPVRAEIPATLIKRARSGRALMIAVGASAIGAVVLGFAAIPAQVVPSQQGRVIAPVASSTPSEIASLEGWTLTLELTEHAESACLSATDPQGQEFRHCFVPTGALQVHRFVDAANGSDVVVGLIDPATERIEVHYQDTVTTTEAMVVEDNTSDGAVTRIAVFMSPVPSGTQAEIRTFGPEELARQRV